MTWFTLALIPPFFWAISNIVDRYISSNKGRNIWESLIIVNAAKIPFLLVFGWALFWRWVELSWNWVFWWMLLGALYTVAVLLYLIVLQKEEASIVLPLYEIGPIWALILGFLMLNEIPWWQTLIWVGVIIAWAYTLSREKASPSGLRKNIVKIFLIILLSSFLFNITYVLFKQAHVITPLSELFFFQYIFQATFSVLLWFTMNQFRYKKWFPTWDKKIWALSISWESVGIFGTFLIMFSYIAWPVWVVSALSATQMIWVLLLSFLISRFYPHHLSEQWDTDNRMSKIIGVLIIFVGVLVLWNWEL